MIVYKIMFGIGIPEVIVILIVALLVVGPAKLPELAKSLGKALSEFRRMADEVKETFEDDINQETHKEGQSQDINTQENVTNTEENKDDEQNTTITDGRKLSG